MAINPMRDDDPALRAGVVAAPVMTMTPVVAVIVAGANRDADILSLCSSRGVDDSKTQHGGSDCNVFHAYLPLPHDVRQNDFVRVPFHALILQIATQRMPSGCVSLRAVESPLRRKKGAV